MRSGIIRVVPDSPTTLPTLEITVTQAAGLIIPNPNLLFPGSDFNNWTDFLANITTATEGSNAQGLNPIISQSMLGGMGYTSALRVNGTITATAELFTGILAPGFSTGLAAIEFQINGTADRSMAVTLTDGTGNATGNIVHAWNLGDVGVNDINAVYNGIFPQYAGTIDTEGNWVTVRLDLMGIDISNATRFQIRAGGLSGGNTFDLLIDNIVKVPLS